jgi:CheY-like chemotaxis protein
MDDEQREAAMGGTPPIRILVVEDERITARSVEVSLKDAGYQVVSITASGEEALRKAEHLRPDLVLMDIRLNGFMDGVYATQRIHAQFDIPVVYMTAYSDDETLRRIEQSKAYGYVAKPFREQALLDAVQEALAWHRAERQSDPKGSSPVTKNQAGEN